MKMSKKPDFGMQVHDLAFLRKNYRIKESIGSGAYGDVFRVKHRQTNKEFAVKYIRDFMRNETLARCAVREVTILRQLSQTPFGKVFTTELHDVVIAGDKDTFRSMFLVIDYVPQDMRTLLQNKNLEFDLDHALIIFYNLLCGIKFLHSANIIHRDLKPANILVNYDSEIKICDFGMARTVESLCKVNFEEETLIMNPRRQMSPTV